MAQDTKDTKTQPAEPKPEPKLERRVVHVDGARQVHLYDEKGKFVRLEK
jgi:hypothetical protein